MDYVETLPLIGCFEWHPELSRHRLLASYLNVKVVFEIARTGWMSYVLQLTVGEMDCKETEYSLFEVGSEISASQFVFRWCH